MMFCVMIGIYVIAILIDKIRIMMWNIFTNTERTKSK